MKKTRIGFYSQLGIPPTYRRSRLHEAALRAECLLLVAIERFAAENDRIHVEVTQERRQPSVTFCCVDGRQIGVQFPDEPLVRLDLTDRAHVRFRASHRSLARMMIERQCFPD